MKNDTISEKNFLKLILITLINNQLQTTIICSCTKNFE